MEDRRPESLICEEFYADGLYVARTSRTAARDDYLEALARIKPEVLSSLDEKVLPLYAPLFNADWSLRDTVLTDRRDALRFADETIQSYRHYPLELRQGVSRLNDALREWAREWWLREVWCMDRALQTMAAWCRDPNCRRDRFAPAMATMYSGFYSYRCLQFTYRAWDPRVEKWDDYQRRLKAALTRSLPEYRARKLSGISEEDRAKEHGPAHYRWLVEYQVNGKDYTQIAQESAEADRSTVSKAVRSLAKQLRLPLRPRERADFPRS